MLSRCMVRSVSIVGAGRVGTTLGKRLRELGWRIGAVVARSAASSRTAVRAIGGGTAHASVNRHVFDAGIVLVSTPDGALATVAHALAQAGGAQCHGKIVLHTSGAFDRAVFAPLARLGAATGSLHPMQTFSGRRAPKLEGVIFAVEGDPAALRAAQAIARALGGAPVKIRGANKPAYHAAGALVAGHALALVEAATRILVGIGFTRRGAIEALLPLMRQTLDNFEAHGPQASWTGPIARGDYATVARHRKAFRKYPREFWESYAALALLGGRVLSKNPNATLSKLKRAWHNPRGGQR